LIVVTAVILRSVPALKIASPAVAASVAGQSTSTTWLNDN